MADILTPEERAAIAAYPARKVKRVPAGTNGEPVPYWCETRRKIVAETYEQMRARMASAAGRQVKARAMGQRKRGQVEALQFWRDIAPALSGPFGSDDSARLTGTSIDAARRRLQRGVQLGAVEQLPIPANSPAATPKQYRIARGRG